MDDNSLIEEAEPAPPSTSDDYSANAVQLLRTVQVNSLLLSQMADQKASILMGATFLVFSIAVSRSLAGDMPWALGVLAVFAFLSALLAVLAVLPSVRKPDGGQKPNLMFFGHFAHRDEEEWMQEVLARLHEDEGVFRTMLHDIYQNGQVLQRRKYRYLGYAYRVFIVGLFFTLGAFVIEFGATY
ncbi:DUF5706 domain-containing protein [Aurantiacibacter sp. MUD11]|uniref:Pycsar system effector family protein n=1 Tax=Aurantiacibacter sp. MUD11 TaxID=3003265 RepID=UPI0022AA5A86|nr:Pycsar system effector family protein [Aurantiacibacter sp. MUD11]WAT17333.1 DUF5706 domain-containing protein [Aurantiacibacter sp. MUD11]